MLIWKEKGHSHFQSWQKYIYWNF